MFCTRCGTQNPDDAGFCRNCSSPLTRPTSHSGQQTAPQPSQPTSGSYANPPSSQSSQSPYPGYQGPPVYQSSYANQPMTQQTGASGRAIASMILSILGLVMCGFLTSIPGLILGKMELNDIKLGKAPKAGETMAKVGFYVGIAGTVISCLAGIAGIVLWIIGAAGSMN